jgi:F0F1-type ATP synthase membrane subunit c/vacuolar-type H+-ATPase subunit K
MATGPGLDAGAPPREGPSTLSTIVRTPVALLLVALMAVGSVFLWIGIPVGWIWVASRMVDTSQPTLGPYLLILFAVPVSMWIVGKLLFRLNLLFSRLTGRNYEVKAQLPWHKSMRGERASNRPTTVLDIVMIVSVGLALLAFSVWFFLFAGSSLPT